MIGGYAYAVCWERRPMACPRESERKFSDSSNSTPIGSSASSLKDRAQANCVGISQLRIWGLYSRGRLKGSCSLVVVSTGHRGQRLLLRHLLAAGACIDCQLALRILSRNGVVVGVSGSVLAAAPTRQVVDVPDVSVLFVAVALRVVVLLVRVFDSFTKYSQLSINWRP